MKLIKRIFYFLIPLMFIVLACNKEQNPLVNTILVLGYQEVEQIPIIESFIRLDSVNDTRCPADVFCGHAGWVTVNVSLKSLYSTTKPMEQMELDLYHKDTFENLIFSLLEVNPYPLYQTPVPLEDKQIVLQIESF